MAGKIKDGGENQRWRGKSKMAGKIKDVEKKEGGKNKDGGEK